MTEKPVTASARSSRTTDGFRLQPIQSHQVTAILDPRTSVKTLLERAKEELEIQVRREEKSLGNRRRNARARAAERPLH